MYCYATRLKEYMSHTDNSTPFEFHDFGSRGHVVQEDMLLAGLFALFVPADEIVKILEETKETK